MLTFPDEMQVAGLQRLFQSGKENAELNLTGQGHGAGSAGRMPTKAFSLIPIVA